MRFLFRTAKSNKGKNLFAFHLHYLLKILWSVNNSTSRSIHFEKWLQTELFYQCFPGLMIITSIIVHYSNSFCVSLLQWWNSCLLIIHLVIHCIDSLVINITTNLCLIISYPLVSRSLHTHNEYILINLY